MGEPGKKTSLQFDLNEFINGENSICREERQYALFLYNLLWEKRFISVRDEKDPYNIVELFYEVSFLRDYFYKCKETEEKALFNKKLISFSKENCKTKQNGDLQINEDTLSKHVNSFRKNDEIWDRIGTKLPQYLMNAQPDLGLILEKDENYYLCFIECKYKSGFGKYPSDGKVELDGDEVNGEKGYDQMEVQEKMLNFLCGQDIPDGLHVKYKGVPLTPLPGAPVLDVHFSNSEATDKICIEDLMPENRSKDGKFVISNRHLIYKKTDNA